MKSLPTSATPCFWDVDFSELDVEKDDSFIIRRLFEVGDLPEMQWLLKSYSLEQLRTQLKTCRTLSPKSATFWSLALQIPLGELACTQRRFSPEHETAWPY